jgi:hypothetical protein
VRSVSGRADSEYKFLGLAVVGLVSQFIAMSSKVEAILNKLTLEEKVALLAGKDFWETVPIPGKGVPAIKVWTCIPSLYHSADAR